MRYLELAELYQRLEATTKRLEKTRLIAEFLRKKKDIEKVVLLLQGRVFPTYDEAKLGVAAKLAIKAINVATGISAEEIEQEWKQSGDLGLVAEKLVAGKQQSTLFSGELTVAKVFANLRKLPTIEGSGSVDRKIGVIAELLTSAQPLEARYIMRSVLEELRVGVGDSAIRDAIMWAYFGDELSLKVGEKMEVGERDKYNEYVEGVQHAFDVCNDWGAVALSAQLGLKELHSLGVEIGNPIKVQNPLKVSSVAEGLAAVGKPAQLERKYDGFRMQVHKKGKQIMIFTRRLENVTKQFPEIVEFIKQVKGEDFILDGEAVGFDPKTGKYRSFQFISQRIRRKYGIEKMAEELPVELNIFDILEYNGKSLIAKPLSERRALLEQIVKPLPRKIVLAKRLVTGDENLAEAFYQEALSEGFEGIMMKAVGVEYKPGKRVGYWVKLKPSVDCFDLVIVEAEYGEGKRSGWLTSYTLACMDDGNILGIGKSSTGLKEKRSEGLSFEEMTELLKPLIVSEKGRSVKVKPEIILEVGYQEIQKSPTYGSGFALRFPTVVRLREDKGLEDVSTLEMVKKAFEKK
ncbi:MAG: ATP-dependent DNA ligase [Candidatus Woesearchaeota archaeon]